MVGFFLIVVLLTVILPRKRVGQVWMETIITYFSPFVNRKREIYARLCRDDIHRTMRGDDIPTCVEWYTKPAAWIKKPTSKNLSVFWCTRLDSRLWRRAPLNNYQLFILPLIFTVCELAWQNAHSRSRLHPRIQSLPRYINQKTTPQKGDGLFGVPDWIRTNGTKRRRLVLYPAELRIRLYHCTRFY